MNTSNIMKRLGIIILATFSVMGLLHATAQPKFTIIPITSTTLILQSTEVATVDYRVTNQTKITRTLTMIPLTGISQTSSGSGICSNPFTLAQNQSCTLSLQINAAQLPIGAIQVGVELCKTEDNTNTPDRFLCSQTSSTNELKITRLSV
ncbi:MAG: hypothetical protein Q8R24_07390 [Legionellaceae bacterium]|nr:hypothetical protein [Legionellaceae bacterium]